MKVNEIYIQLALTYRLSLKTMMKLMHKTQEEIYNELVKTCNSSYYRPLKFLFEQDTGNENSEIERQKELLAKNFLLSYKKGNENTKKELLFLLTNIDKKFKELINKAKKKEDLKPEDCEIIMRYRIKYACSRNEVMALINRNVKALESFEKTIEDPLIRSQLDKLNSYYLEKSGKQIQKFKSSSKK